MQSQQSSSLRNHIFSVYNVNIVAIMIKVDASSRTPFLEFLKYPGLIYFITWRDLKVRYKQAVLGMLWTILQPLFFALVIGTIIVERINVDFGFTNVSDLAIIVLGFSIWTFFEASFSGAAGSLLSNQGLMKKIYFPKTIPIISAVVTRLVDLLLSMIVFLGFLIFTGSEYHMVGFLVLVPVILVLSLATFFSGIALAPLNIRFRDVRFILPFITRLMFFSTPIWYPFNIIPERFQGLFLLNPVVAAIELTRNAFFDPSAIQLSHVLPSLLTVVVLGAIAIPIYKNQESKIVDYV